MALSRPGTWLVRAEVPVAWGWGGARHVASFLSSFKVGGGGEGI